LEKIMDSRHEKGMTLVEVLVGIGILAVLIFASVSLTTSALTTTRANLDRQFATEKAISMLEELKSVAQNTSGGNIVVLDQYDDGVLTKDELTIQTGALPADPISGNMQGPLGWLYQRRVSIIRIGGQSNAGVRLVRVAVFRNDKSGMRLLAEVSSVVRTLATILPQSQVYDVYCIAAENVPGWWVYTSSLVPFVQNSINELEDRNPGLMFRVHWITELSYGRNEEYRPYINSSDPITGSPSTSDINSVYFYPGALPQSNAALNPPDLDEYYPVARFNAHMNVDGADSNGFNAATNLFPYAVADQYNHSMRYMDEMATWQARFNAGQETELTYRLLLDQMVMNPSRYTNSILINLHGELFPFPPIRNFSDPARDPEQIAAPDLRNIRVVTHPENLAYGNTNAATDDIKLRVYSYEAPTGTAVTANPGVMPVPITVLVKGVDLTSVGGTVSVQAIEGGPGLLMVTQSGNPTYARVNAVFGPPLGLQMYATVGTVAGAGGTTDTLITLYNSPLRAPQCVGGNCNGNPNNGMGLPAAGYLYNQQYIPAPLENFASNAAFVTPFTIDLTSLINGPKNTARWVITINSNNLNTILTNAGFPTTNALTIETRIGALAPGAPPTSGTVAGSLPLGSQVWPPAMTQQTNTFPPLIPTSGQPGAPAARSHPANLSRTYVWRGTNLWLYGDGSDANPAHLPLTERVQFLGDPRHCPYADLKRPHVTNTFKGLLFNNESPLGMGYNRYFDDFENAANGNQAGLWPGWKYTVGATTYGVKNNGTANDDGWDTGGSGQLEIDIQRAFQIVRNSLTVGRSIYTTMTGFSYYYVGIGGEIGYDAANQFPNSIPLSTKPFTGNSGTTTEQSIINNGAQAQGCGVKYVRAVGAGTNYWWSMNWLGELYPDTVYTGTYAATPANITAGTAGNLPTGNGANNYRRVLRATIAPTNAANFTLPSGTTFNGGLPGSGNEGANAVRRTNVQGSTNLFWTGTAASTFHHIFADGTFGNLTAQGLDIAAATTGYNFPLLNPAPNARPFSITNNNPGFNPESFLESEYGPMFPAKQEALFYQHSSGVPGSALESLREPTSNKVAFIVVNGLSPAGATGQSYIAHWSFISLIHSFFQAGLYTDATACPACPYRVRQLPRVSITYPNVTVDLNNVSSINIQWALAWKRWDNNSYTPGYAAGFAETEPVQYQVMYSDDNGTTWKWCDTALTSTPRPGLRDATALINVTNFIWNTPAASFPMGNYLIRVEAFRQNYQQHYSFHQFRAFIRR
jgi:type II secretory pathway pseudopilin PulG